MMKNTMIIYKKIILIINLLIGLLIVGFTLYRRFLMAHLPKSLFIFGTVINYSLLITIIIGFLFSLYQIYINIYSLIKKKNIKPNMFTKLQKIIENALFDLYNIICNNIPDIYSKISLLAENFYAFFHKYVEYFLLFIQYLIRLLIVIAFLIDTFIFFKFDYFYKMLYLLCISLLIKLLLYILRDFANNLDFAESILIIEHKGLDVETQLPITEYCLKEEFNGLNLDYYIKQYILCSKLTGYFKMYDNYSNLFTAYFNIGIYSLYLVGWFYILFQNVFN